MDTLTADKSYSSNSNQYKPRLIFWKLPKGCNVRCIHCCASASELSSLRGLSTVANAIINQIAEASRPTLVLSGGEPLLGKDIFELAGYATDKGPRSALATNGTLVTSPVALRIVDSGVKRVVISLDGANALTHDTFCKIPGAFDAAITSFRNLRIWACRCRLIPTVAATMLISCLRFAIWPG